MRNRSEILRRSIRNRCRTVILASVAAGLSVGPVAISAQPESDAVSFDELRQEIRRLQNVEAEEARKREAAFLERERRQEQRTREAVSRRGAAEAASARLDREWQDNEESIAELGLLLKQHQGNLGEVFGVTRQVAGDAANILQQSLLGAEYRDPEASEDRVHFLQRLAAAKTLPSIIEMERLWFEMHREMTGSGKVVRFRGDVLQLDGVTATSEDVVRIGPFTAVADGVQLGYLPARGILAHLDGSLPGSEAAAARLDRAAGLSLYLPAMVDPSRGALLGLHLQRPDLLGRIEHGGAVGYLILAVGALGFLAGAFQYAYLFRIRRAVNAQLRNPAQPDPANPLGRVLMALHGRDHVTASVELAELRISEAVLKEVPILERFQSFLRLVVAAGPLLGLIGTVIGMIITFKTITASGTSDPKLMAHGIGQAMIATVLGLGIAIPLLFVNAALAAASDQVTQVLSEQGQALLARIARLPAATGRQGRAASLESASPGNDTRQRLADKPASAG